MIIVKDRVNASLDKLIGKKINDKTLNELNLALLEMPDYFSPEVNSIFLADAIAKNETILALSTITGTISNMTDSKRTNILKSLKENCAQYPQNNDHQKKICSDVVERINRCMTDNEIAAVVSSTNNIDINKNEIHERIVQGIVNVIEPKGIFNKTITFFSNLHTVKIDNVIEGIMNANANAKENTNFIENRNTNNINQHEIKTNHAASLLKQNQANRHSQHR